MPTLTPMGNLRGTLSGSSKRLKGSLVTAISDQTIKLIEEYVIAALLDGETVDSIKAQVIAELTDANMLVTAEDLEKWDGIINELTEANALVTPEDREKWNAKLTLAVNPNNSKNLLVTENSQ